MSSLWIRFVTRPVESPAESCVSCDEPVGERWDPDKNLCARCALDAELFDRDSRRERGPAAV
jgi:hypothetical protein